MRLAIASASVSAVFIALTLNGHAQAKDEYRQDYCKVRAERSASVDVGNARRVVLRTGAGELEVRGDEGVSRIEASGRACASSEELLAATTIHVRMVGDTAHVETAIPVEKLKMLERAYAYIDVKVRLPANLPVEAHDSSGDARLEQLASLDMRDSSGDLEIERVRGELRVSDSSGDVRITTAASLRIEDSSGDVFAKDIGSGVEVVSDSSGDLVIEGVGGTVDIRRDSSGDIRVSDVKGSVLVGVDSSGSIVARNVTGDFTVETDGSGDISHDGVKGRVSTPE